MIKIVTRQKPATLLFAAFFVFLFSTYGFAENSGSITGTVKDGVTKEVLPAVSVFIPSLKVGANTDIKGAFHIPIVPAGNYELIVRLIGYRELKQQIAVKTGSSAEANLEIYPAAIQLNDVVVTGQGIATPKKKLTASVETISLQDIKNAPVESLDQLLQGRIPGLSSFSSSGMPGTAGRMSTRGLKSVVTKSTPVIYVDNVRVDNQEAYRLGINTGGAETSSLSDLMVGEIDHIEVIKGGASSTLFGSEAANGVIQIFTKKGIPGQAKWSFNFTSGFDEPFKKFVSEDFVKNKVLKTGGYQAYTIGVTGGSPTFTYNVGAKTQMSTGVLSQNVGQSKYYNLNAGFRVVMSQLSNIEVSTSFTNVQNTRTDNNNLPTAPYGGFEDYSHSDSNGYTEEMRNADLATMLTNDIKDRINRFRTTLNYDYTPVPGFINRFTAGIDYRKNEDRQFVPKKSGDFFGTPNGYLNRSDREYLTLTMAYSGSYKLPQLFDMIDQNIAFGAQGFRVEDREETASGTGFSIPGTTDFDNANRTTAQESNRQLFNGGIYIFDQVGLMDKIFLDFGIRADGNSTFGSAIGMQVYPKIGAAYNISDEDFFPVQLRMAISSLKLRASWGQTGNFPAPFTRDRTYRSNSYLGSSALAFNNPGNKEIKPEKTTSIDLGFDSGFLDDRISMEFNYFTQTTKDALFQVPRDPTTGFGNQQTNVGEISNKGIELALVAQVLQSESASLTMRFSYATLENKVESLGGAAPFTATGFIFLPSRVEEGYPVGTFRINVPIKDASGNYTGEYRTELYGTPFPKKSGSISFDLTVMNNLTISALAEYAFGHQVVNLKKTLRYFNGAPDAVNAVPDGYDFQTASSVWLEDADWIKIREVSLTYRIPSEWISGFTLNASVRNLATFATKTSKLDPELNSFQDSGRAAPGGYGFLDISAPVQYRFGLTYSL